MKYLLAAIAFSLFSFTGATAQNIEKPFILSGTVTGRDTGYIVLRYINKEGGWVIDTTYLNKGNFSFKGNISEPVRAIIVGYPTVIDFDEVNYVNIFLEPTTQNIQLTENHYAKAKITGSHTQEVYSLYLAKIDSIKTKYRKYSQALLKEKYAYKNSKTSKEKKDALRREANIQTSLLPLKKEILRENVLFVEQHLNSYVSPFIFYYPAQKLPIDSAKRIYNSFTTKIKESLIGKEVYDLLQKRINNSVGHTPYSFDVKDINGKRISLSGFTNKIVLIDFWASWCAPCREEIPHLKKLFKVYENKGLNIVAISIDTDTVAWQEAVEKEQIGNWYNILVTREISSHFENVHQPIPSKILIDRTGKIIWKSSMETVVSLDDALKKYVK